MNVVPPSTYPFGHGFWPFASCAGMKSMDMSIHPAFLHTPYPTYALTHCNAAPVSPMHPGMRSKSDSFTIDAILNRDKKESPVEKSKSPNYQEHEQCKKDIEIISRRHQRIYENSHPYLSPVEKKSSQVSAKKSPESTLKEIEKDQEKTSEGKQTWKQGKGKRVRTIFTPEQLERLETEFEKQQYMVGTERYYLACSLNLTEAQVKVWFQNRRIKWRKQTLEQQQAKLARFDIFKDTTGSESGYSDDEEDKDDKTHKFPTSPDQRCVTAEVPSTSYSPY